MERNYLPIGSVVILKNGKKRMMITGFCAKTDLDENKTFDYIGVLYPEGTITSDTNLVFDHNQIEKVFFTGYSDEEEKRFKEALYKNLEEDNN